MGETCAGDVDTGDMFTLEDGDAETCGVPGVLDLALEVASSDRKLKDSGSVCATSADIIRP